MVEKKVVFFGPVGAGKSTAIRAVSDKACVETDASISDSTRLRKQQTTVALDYGILQRSKARIHLYGTPGQSRFRFMWEMIGNELAPDSAGYVLLLDYRRNHPEQDLKYYLRQFGRYLQDKPLIIGVTGMDQTGEPDHQAFQTWLSNQNCNAPLYFIDGRIPGHIRFLLHRLLQPQSEKPAPADVIPLQSGATSETSEPTTEPQPRLRRRKSKQYFHSALLQEVEALKQVTGIALINKNGFSEYNTLPELQFHEMSQFIANLLKKIPELDGFEYIRSTQLNEGTEGFFTLLVAENKILGVHATEKTTSRALQQEIENLLQWGPEE